MAQPKWVVASVSANDDHTLDLTFADGTTGRFDMAPYLDSHIYRPLRSIAIFRLAHIECGTVVWSDDIDIAPERLWEECAAR